MGTNGSKLKFAIKLFSLNCLHTGTFPAVRSLQHPLVKAFVGRRPLSPKAVSGEISEPLLLRGHCLRLSAHKGIKSGRKNSLTVPSSKGLLLVSAFWPSAHSGFAVLWSQSPQHKPMISFLSASSQGTALPFALLLMFFFSPFSAAHSFPFTANGACGL